MKRLLALIIIAVTILPLFAFPINAEEKHEIVLYENGQYKINFSINDSEEDNNFFINLLVSHTGTPYDESIIKNDDSAIYFASGKFVDELNNKITYDKKNNMFCIGYDSPENRTALFNKLTEKIQSLPQDRIVLDNSFFSLSNNTDDEKNEETKEKESIYSFFKGTIASIDKNTAKLTIEAGGFNYVTKDSPLNNIISTIYKFLYPVGFITMLLCWGFGIAKSTISTSLDIKDKSSIIHSVINLMLGIAAMSLAPQILTLLTGVSQWICNSIFDICLQGEFLKDITFPGALSILKMFGSDKEALFITIVLLVVDLIFIINILWIALLQCLSPIFIGLMANQGTRKISFNFIKEYFKAMLVPVVTVIYFFLASTIVQETNIGGMIVALVLAISTLGIAGKKLDKLIN